ncbi:MAG: B12-binding domain-containing radical SAM protein, partial [Erysipelotrichia bacterium]|nr:B12-binding domain-containing radical SAM protein [Erysipelotrichia bacterium]
MKVALISHPNKIYQKPDFPPIGIAYLGAVARDMGFETLLIDAGQTTILHIQDEIKAFAPDFIGTTCWTINRETVWELCAKLKLVAPNAFLALGGSHSSLFPVHVFAKTHASAVVTGEGEATFRELLLTLAKKGDLHTVNGLALRNPDGTAYLTEKRERITDLDSIALPYYQGFKNFSFDNYLGFPGLPRPTAPIISSRGCVFDCSYCSSVSFWGNTWRGRSADNILTEIEWLLNEMGARSIYFFDDNFTVKKDRVFELCDGIKSRNLNFSWACCSHVKLVNPELLKRMHECGCVGIDFGVESGSNKILRQINKKQTREDIEKAFSAAHSAGINPRAYLMVGNIGETTDTIDETVDLIGKINPKSSIGAQILLLLPGTPEYRNAVKNNFLQDDYWLHTDGVPYNLQ